MENVPPVPADFISTLWSYFKNLNVTKFPFSTEANTSSLVEITLNDMICDFGCQMQVKVVREKKGFSWEPDLTITAACHPIGGVEIKKGLKKAENETVVGEVFDQLMHFKHYWRIKVFVIFSSYREWRVWLDDKDSKELASRVCKIMKVLLARLQHQ